MHLATNRSMHVCMLLLMSMCILSGQFKWHDYQTNFLVNFNGWTAVGAPTLCGVGTDINNKPAIWLAESKNQVNNLHIVIKRVANHQSKHKPLIGTITSNDYLTIRHMSKKKKKNFHECFIWRSIILLIVHQSGFVLQPHGTKPYHQA